MNSPDSIREFLAQFRRALPVKAGLAERITAEVEDHLLEVAQQLQTTGLSQDQAEREAIARFGRLKRSRSALATG